jgi:hypothetical protein
MALERRGWLVRSGEAAWRLALTGGKAAARTDLDNVDRRAMVRLARLFADFEALVEAHARRVTEENPVDGAQAGQADPPPERRLTAKPRRCQGRPGRAEQP